MSKRIHDLCHGTMELNDIAVDLMHTAEVQRLRRIKQMSLAEVVFPSANHTRFAHSIGTSYLAIELANKLNLPEKSTRLLAAGGMLHDLGHTGFSHALEPLVEHYLGLDHMELSKDVITGSRNIMTDKTLEKVEEENIPRVKEVIKDYGFTYREVSRLPLGAHRNRPYMGSIIHGALDVDMVDYLSRDALATGVALGNIDKDRILNSILIHNKKLAISDKGIEAVEGLLTARTDMYSAVYLHRTTKCATAMLMNAVAHAIEVGILPEDEFYKYTDDELMGKLRQLNDDYVKRIITRIENRKLYKRALFKERTELEQDKLEEVISSLKNIKDRRNLQKQIEDKAGVNKGDVIIQSPLAELGLTEPRMGKTGIKVLKGDNLVDIAELSSLVKSIQERPPIRYSLQVLCPKRKRNKVRRATKKVLDLD